MQQYRMALAVSHSQKKSDSFRSEKVVVHYERLAQEQHVITSSHVKHNISNCKGNGLKMAENNFNIAMDERIKSGMCRLCLSSNGALIDMFSFSSELESSIADAVMKCTSVHVEKHSKLPSTICDSCYMQLVKTQDFQIQTLESDRTLQVYLQQLQVDDEQSILGSSLILPENLRISINLVNQDKEEQEVKPCVKYSGSGGSAFENDNAVNEMCNLKSKSRTEWDVYSSTDPSTFDPNLVVKAEPIISEPENDQFDMDTGILNYVAVIQGNIDSENEVSSVKTTSYNCDVCNKSFSKSAALKKHQRIHTGEKQYQCDVCNKSFSKISNLKSHQLIHTGEKPYQCDACSKCFSKSATLKIHQRIHTGEKPYQCDVCNKCFCKSTTLRIHQRIHTGEKPYRCDVCNNSFYKISNLKSHQRIHTGEKPYQCDVCAKCFSKLDHLSTHQRVHTGEKPYQCDVCKKRFSHASAFKRHELVHTGVKPYQCDVCNKSFNKLDNLKAHQRIHAGEKPYECLVCNKRFTQLSGLKSHKRKHAADV